MDQKPYFEYIFCRRKTVEDLTPTEIFVSRHEVFEKLILIILVMPLDGGVLDHSDHPFTLADGQ